jgi:hypothetical protein
LLIDFRKLAALDLVFHGPRFVLIEFAGAVALTGGLAALSLRSGLLGPGHPVLWEIAVGGFLASIGVNYLPLLIYAVALVRSGTARQEVAHELEQAQQSQRRYGAQQFLLAVPFAVLVIAVVQTIARRARGGAPSGRS